MQHLLALIKARNIEFVRDRGALMWAVVFPLLIIVGCALAFSDEDQSVIKLGVVAEQTPSLRLLDKDYVKVETVQQLASGQDQVRYHQLDLLLSQADNGAVNYWVNPSSAKGEAALALLQSSDPEAVLSAAELSGQAVRYVDWVMPGVLAMNMMFASLFGIGFIVVRYRQNGVLKRLQATPINAGQFIGAQMLSRLLIVVSINTTIFIGCKWALDIPVNGNYLLLLIILIMGALSLLSLGLLIASRTASEELAGGILNAATWPMMFFSEIWFSLQNAPVWMQTMAQFMPLTHAVQAGRAVMIQGASFADVSYHLIVLAGITLVCGTLAARLFRWTKD